jgi:glutathione S-transferase
MAALQLVIGSKNYSSWSLRPWLALRMAGLAFEEIRIPLYQPGAEELLARWSPTRKVPVLRHGDVTVQESLAICEYAAELAPAAGLWPADRAARAHARAVSAEMHAGFAALRSAMPMNLRVRDARIPVGDAVRVDVDRVVALWQECRTRFGAGGELLFGGFTIADAMFAPVATRFRTYGVPLPAPAQAYCEAVLGLAPVREWYAAAAVEKERIERTEAVAAAAAR